MLSRSSPFGCTNWASSCCVWSTGDIPSPNKWIYILTQAYI